MKKGEKFLFILGWLSALIGEFWAILALSFKGIPFNYSTIAFFLIGILLLLISMIASIIRLEREERQ
jgi:hypothetical protein